MALGARNRSTSATAMNEGSSRSHALLSLYVTARPRAAPGGGGGGGGAGASSRLNIVDLAGSEVPGPHRAGSGLVSRRDHLGPTRT